MDSSVLASASLVEWSPGFMPPPGSYFAFSIDRHPYLMDSRAAGDRNSGELCVGYVSEVSDTKIMIQHSLNFIFATE